MVAIRTEGFEQWQICCAYVPMEGAGVGPAALRAALARLIPGYMIPARWRRYDALPRNTNGKVDRPCLKEAFTTVEMELQT